MLSRLALFTLVFAGCSDPTADLIALTPEALMASGWPPGLPQPMVDPPAYRIAVVAEGHASPLGGGSATEHWERPDGAVVPRFWCEKQSVSWFACPGPSCHAFVAIRQPIVGGVRRDGSSTIDIDVTYRPYQKPQIRWQQTMLVNLLKPQELSGNGITLRIERRTP